MKFGTSNQTYCNDYLILNSPKTCCKAKACHLCNLIESNVKADVQKNINVFISNVNIILCHFHLTNTEVKYKLSKSYCILLYGCCLWSRCKQRLCNMVKMDQTFIEYTI